MYTTLSVYTEEQDVHAIAEGGPVIAVTSLGYGIYVLKPERRNQVEVYDVVTERLQRRLTVPNTHGRFADMTSCEHHLCVYISAHIDECVHRVDLDGEVLAWAVEGKPCGLSVNKAHHLLVTCADYSQIKEFSSHGDYIRRVILPCEVVNPWHAIQLTKGQFVVCHGAENDIVHRVCVMSYKGFFKSKIVHSHGGLRGSDNGQHNVPSHLAVDDNEFVFVADVINRRVTLLTPTLKDIRQVVSRDKRSWRPRRLHFDSRRRRLYVAENQTNDNMIPSGRVVVFSV